MTPTMKYSVQTITGFTIWFWFASFSMPELYWHFCFFMQTLYISCVRKARREKMQENTQNVKYTESLKHDRNNHKFTKMRIEQCSLYKSNMLSITVIYGIHLFPSILYKNVCAFTTYPLGHQWPLWISKPDQSHASEMQMNQAA